LSEGQVTLSIDGMVARIAFDRPQAHNAMTFAMYDQLSAICDRLSADSGVRAIVLRGEGGNAFVSGTDISQLSEIADAEDGLAYEARIDTCVGNLERLPQPTLALIDGWAVGGGLALAAACDFRLATPKAKFGAPIARTVGNCYSSANTKRLLAGFGAPRTKRILLLGEMIDAAEARKCGFLLDVVAPHMLRERADQVVARLLQNAPLTIHVSKEMIRRIQQDEDSIAGADLIAAVYGSQDFRTGVRAFVSKTLPVWSGR
jgi:enoyl-CoA hydratase/carnithine racemase